MNRPRIAFVGKAGSGKTSAANYLVQNYGYRRVSVATPLKIIAEDLWGPGGVTRTKLQRLGVAVRDIEENTWIDYLLRRSVPGGAGPVVVDDCRFPNEFERLQNAGFRIVRILSDTPDRIKRLKANGKWDGPEALSHESETALDDLGGDLTVDNFGDLLDFYDVVKRLMERFDA